MLWKHLFLTVVCLVTVCSAQLVLEGEDDGEESRVATDPMTRMLQWGVENSDLSDFAKKAQLIREGKMKPPPVDREVMDLLFGDKAKFLEKCVAKLKQTVAEGGADNVVEALEELEDQAQDIDNAGDLDHVGGLDIVIELLSHNMPKVRQAAFWVLGTTVQSHPKMQELSLAKGVLPMILAPLKEAAGSTGDADARLIAKNVYALSSLLRSCPACINAFSSAGGAQILVDLVRTAVAEPRGDEAWLSVKRKLVALMGDLVQEEGVTSSNSVIIAAYMGDNTSVVAELPQILRSSDAELQEKTMQTMEALIIANPGFIGILENQGLRGELGDLIQRTMDIANLPINEGISHKNLPEGSMAFLEHLAIGDDGKFECIKQKGFPYEWSDSFDKLDLSIAALKKENFDNQLTLK